MHAHMCRDQLGTASQKIPQLSFAITMSPILCSVKRLKLSFCCLKRPWTCSGTFSPQFVERTCHCAGPCDGGSTLKSTQQTQMVAESDETVSTHLQKGWNQLPFFFDVLYGMRQLSWVGVQRNLQRVIILALHALVASQNQHHTDVMREGTTRNILHVRQQDCVGTMATA